MKSYRRPLEDRFFEKVVIVPFHACWEWIGAKNDWGYGSMRAWHKTMGAHRVSYKMHHGEIPGKLLVLHKCDNPGCVRPEHLFLGSDQDNATDKVAKRRQSRTHGIRAGLLCKLTDEKVLKMRSDYASGLKTQQQIADEHGVRQATVSQIILRKRWGHL